MQQFIKITLLTVLVGFTACTGNEKSGSLADKKK